MRHFVQYHNTEKMGELHPDTDDLHVFTSKEFAGSLKGDTIWLIAGKGNNPHKSYYLAYRFVVDIIEYVPDPEFRYRVQGHNGMIFDPQIRLDNRPWWPRFLRSQGNFGFGLHPIHADYVAELEALAGS